MKKSLTLLVILLLTVMSCSKQLEITPEKPEVLVQTQTGTPIGGIVNTTITATGGIAILPSVGVKVIIPAGAMIIGSQLSIQQVSNILNSDEKAIRISGDWIKPISVEYQLTDSESGNYNIFVSMPTGVWVGAKKAKVSGSKMSVRLGPNSGSDIKGGRVAAKTYDLAFAKFFTIKPDRVALDLGKTQQFVAYAKEGFVPRKYVNGSVITSQEELNTYIKTLDALESPTSDDDELVPLASPKNATDNDELVPLAVYAKEYPFSNTKEGYTRLWKINQGVGSVNSNGLYTAPNDEASKGKTAEVWFLSQNNKNTSQNLVAGANIRINDGLARYKGTYSFTTLYIGDNPSLAYPENKLSYRIVEEGALTLKSEDQKNAEFLIDLDSPKSVVISEYSLDRKTTASTGETERRTITLTQQPTAAWSKYDKSKKALIFENNNTYRISFNIPTGNGQIKTVTENNRSGSESSTESYGPNANFTNTDTFNNNPKNTDSNLLIGTRTWTYDIKDTSLNKVIATVTYTAKWNFIKE